MFLPVNQPLSSNLQKLKHDDLFFFSEVRSPGQMSHFTYHSTGSVQNHIYVQKLPRRLTKFVNQHSEGDSDLIFVTFDLIPSHARTRYSLSPKKKVLSK